MSWLRHGWVCLVLLIPGALLFSTLSGAAHPDLLDEISGITRQLTRQGESASLHLKRADLYRRHAEYDKALADVAAAEKLRTNNAADILLERASILCDAGRAEESFRNIQDFFQLDSSTNIEALIIRARCHARLGRAEPAIADYNAAIAHAPAPAPDLYLERAQQQAALGRYAEAVRGLDEVITNAPFMPPLELVAIDYDCKRAAFDAALVRVDAIVARYPVKEPWLALRAEVLEQAGRTREAAQTFQQVLAGIEQYPPIRRSLLLTRQLEERARQGLTRVQSQAPSKTQASSKS